MKISRSANQLPQGATMQAKKLLTALALIVINSAFGEESKTLSKYLGGGG